MAVHGYLVKMGKWSQHKLTELGNNVRYVRDAIIKVNGKDKGVEVLKGKSSGPQASFEQGVVQKYWRPQLHNFKSTLKENASKIQQQLNYRNAQGKSSYFRNDFIWRRARKGHLLAFAGLFLFQEENQDSIRKNNYQCMIYENVCSHIKDLFPQYEEEHLLPEECGNCLEDFDLNSPTIVSNGVKFEAQLKPEEDAIVVCSEPSSFDNNEVPHFSINSLSNNLLPPVGNITNPKIVYSNEFTVKVVIPNRGVTSKETIVKDDENELVCGGWGYFDDLNYGKGHGPKKKLPAHPNIVMLEHAFVADFTCTTNYPVSVMLPKPTKALCLVTKRHKSTLKAHLEQHHLTAELSLIILQLLEAVAHLEMHNIAHRNINSSNIMLDVDVEGFPRVLLGEFGDSYCAISMKNMKVPFQHHTLDTRLNHLSTQAPEISRASCGRFKSVDYSRSDAWSVGCVVQEVFTGRNPFKDLDASGFTLDSRTYTDEDIPSIDREDVSKVVKIVAELLLKCDPRQRLSAGEAADIIHLDLFASPPSLNLPEDAKHEELRSWVISHCAEVFARKRENSVLFQLCQSFFHRLNSLQVLQGFHLWMTVKEQTI